MGYPGGKGRMWQHVAALMPPHDVYIETHLGGGSVLRNKAPSRLSIGIDVDPRVTDLARSWGVPGLEVLNEDALAFLDRYPFDGSEVVYADPPYPMSSRSAARRLYRHECEGHHRNLIARLRRLDCPVIVSGYPNTVYSESLRDWNCRTVMNATQGGLREERLWLNYEPGPMRHDYTCLGDGFRDRDRLRRRARNLVARMEAMKAVERHQAVDALLSSEIVGAVIRAELAKTDRDR